VNSQPTEPPAVVELERAVIDAAIEWRQHCSIAVPPKFIRPRYSGALADAVDALRVVAGTPRKDQT
jgi:hypothetical protein